MARIRVEQVVDHLGSRLRGAIDDTLKALAPDANVDAQEFYREMKKNLGRRCRQWEDVPNNYVESD